MPTATPRMNDSRQKRMSDCPSHGHRRRGEAVPVIEALSTLVGGKGGDAGLFSAALAGPFEEILNWHAADSAASPARVATPSGSLNGSTAMSNGGSSVIVLCSTPRSWKTRTAASRSARPGIDKLR